MASEDNRGDCADDGELSLVGEDTHLLAARIAQKLQNTGLACEIFNLVPTDKAVLSRDRIFVLLGLTSLTVLAWSYLLWLSTDMGMGGMDMTGFRMIPSGFGLMVPANIPWQAMEFAFVFVMWIVMMVSMMTPSAAPVFLMYARVGRLTKAQGTPIIPTVWFAAGYLLVWIAFALLATLVQWALERSELLDFTLAGTDNRLAGLLFVAAGLYQWTSLNEFCLTQCQRPFEFVMTHGGYRRDAPGSVMLGLRHGAYCVGCCWTLMALLLVGGVMNVLWIVLLALLAYLERVPPMGRLIARLAGIALIAAGAWLFSMGMS